MYRGKHVANAKNGDEIASKLILIANSLKLVAEIIRIVRLLFD